MAVLCLFYTLKKFFKFFILYPYTPLVFSVLGERRRKASHLFPAYAARSEDQRLPISGGSR